ncbi:MFS transporter [Halobacteriales archaeon QS_3_64_16]|nr:MAG: MFS transporter [Halobacteriales archaeon QS_3_64_16]
MIGTRMIFPVLLPALSAEFGLTLTTAGLLVTIVWLGYAIGQVPGGVLADRHGARRLLTASVAIVVLGLFAVVLAPTALLLFLSTGLVGVGQSLYPVARITTLSDLYPDRIGRALGLTMATGDLGQTVLPPIAGVLTVAIAWRAGVGFLVPLFVLIAVVLWWTLPDHTGTAGAAESLPIERLGAVVAALREPTFVLLGVILFLYIGILQTFSAFYPTYLIEVKGLSPPVASTVFGLFFAAGIVAKPLAGMGYDRLGIRRSLPLVLGGAIVGFALLPVVDRLWGLLLDTVLISTMLGSGAITQSYLSDAIPAEIEGTGLGAIRSIASMLGATGPVLFGAIADRGYFDEGYVLLAVLVGISTLLTLRLPRE